MRVKMEKAIGWSEEAVGIESWVFFAGKLGNSWKHVGQVWKLRELSLEIPRWRWRARF